MTVICVVSSNRKALEVIGSGLSSVGLEPPNALEAGPIRTFDQWEEAVAGRTAASMQATLRPGRLWERLAMDLLLANLGKPAWYWMSGHSAAFLEFWSELEASVRFVLVCEAPELAIKRAMQSGDEDKLEETLLQWQAIQSQMLRFQHKRPDVSLLLSGPAQDRGPDRIWRQAHAALLQRGWMKPGRTPTPPSPSPEDGGEPQDPVLDYLVRAIVQERPEVLDLADEIRAIAPLLQGQDVGASDASSTLHVDDAAASTSETPTALELAKHYSRLVLSGKRETEAVAAARHELVHELEQERAEKAQALAELERQLQAAQKGQHEASEESELLLSQLHQVQEELEHYFLARQDAKTTLKTIEGGVSRVLAQLPGAFDCEQFEVQACGEMGEEVDVSARAVRVPSGLRDKVGLSMRIDALGSLWLDVERDGSGACLERWPIRAAEESKLSFCPTALIDQSKGQLRLLAQLSASDWELLCGILRLLVQRLAQGLIELDERAAVAIRKAQAAWLNLPLVWRFDEVKLTSSSAKDSHEVIELSFDRVSIGQRRMQRFRFQLQAKRLAGDRIGLPAYLIFPRDTVTQPFEVWLGNTKDVSGRGVMAIEVSEGGPHRTLWANLQSVDRSMIVALCDALPFALSLLSAEPERAARAWKEWADLVKQLRSALARAV